MAMHRVVNAVLLCLAVAGFIGLFAFRGPRRPAPGAASLAPVDELSPEDFGAMMGMLLVKQTLRQQYGIEVKFDKEVYDKLDRPETFKEGMLEAMLKIEERLGETEDIWNVEQSTDELGKQPLIVDISRRPSGIEPDSYGLHTPSVDALWRFNEEEVLVGKDETPESEPSMLIVESEF